MTPTAPFEANDHPLGPGLRLLEASAGTGKTFALAHLALRLVAEEGVDLRELLVVTFTEAAAAELRDRIGRRLQQALEGLEAPGREAPDPVLADWLERRRGDAATAAEAPHLLRGRLLLALEGLDAADVTTIHGFCARTLLRHPVEAGLAPQLRFETDPLPLVGEVVHDYWQTQVLTLPPSLLAGLRQRGVTPAELTRLLLRLDGDPALGLDPLPAELPAGEDLGRLLPRLWSLRWRRFREEWDRHGADLEQDLRAIAARWREAVGAGPKIPFSPRPRKDRSVELDRWLEGQPAEGDYGAVVEQELLRKYFHPGHFSRHARRIEGGEGAVRLPQAELMRALADVVDRPAELVLLHGCHWGRAELRRRRLRNGSAGFGQLLELLDPGGQEEAAPLLEAVAERYRAALIDEFQDTDPIQWRILRRAFGGPGHQLVVVGDPKQAIYRFRGGDLDTYRKARAAAGSCYGLVENRRSTPPLVEALNRLMGQTGLPRSRLEVPAVAARSARVGPDTAAVELLWLGGDRPAGTPPPSRTDLESRLPAMVAAFLVELLERGLLLGTGEETRPLGAGDVCLLVARHHQAEQLRAALERCGVPSRLVSRQDVFATPAAAALQRLLDALADPAAANRLRLLAASPLLGWDARTLATAPPTQWSRLAGEVDRLARRLPRLGLPMVMAELLGSARLARLSLGGRLLADLQQLAELVQEQLHAQRLGPAAAADWLRRLRLDENRRDRDPPEEHQIHSDRAEGAVSVMTVHASKGLEYPVVICPYLWQASSPPKLHRPGSRWEPPGGGGPRLDLHLDPDWGQGHAAAAEQHRADLAERERLAYVAATRAQDLLVLAWGAAQRQEGSPLFPWLLPDEPLPEPDDGTFAARGDDEWRRLIAEAAARRRLDLRIVEPPAGPAAVPAPMVRPPSPPLAAGPVPHRRLDDLWGRSSYSSWTHSEAGPTDPAAEEGRDTADREPVAAAGVEAPPVAAEEEGMARWPEEGPLGAFPRGPGPGDCLHRILERLDYRLPVDTPAGRETVERELSRAGLAPMPLEPVLEGLERVRLSPLGGALGPFRVADLETGRRINEMRFDLTLGLVRAETLASVFTAHPGGDVRPDYGPALAALPVASRGFLTGSVDLVFEAPDPAGGRRWWVLDWKSNWLGRRDGEGRPQACGPRHYGPAAMAELMARNHYVLQAHLYLVALHRYLGWRRPGYRPEDHLGGYAYAFLRGAPGSAGARALPGAVPGMVVERPPLERILALDEALGSG